MEGSVAAEPLVERLQALIRDNEAFIVAARHEREERSMNQFIREEQDRAFQETLRQDQVIGTTSLRTFPVKFSNPKSGGNRWNNI